MRAIARKLNASLHVSRDEEDLRALATHAIDDEVDRLLVAGGDGTLHHTVQALAGSTCALGILPLGSANDLAHVLKIPRDPWLAARTAVEGDVRQIDLGRVGGCLYAGVAGVGFDSEACRSANASVRIFRGRLIYAAAALRTLVRFKPYSMRIEHDGGVFDGRVMFAVLANAPQYGGGMRVAPHAQLDDAMLDLVIFKEIPRLELAACFTKVFRGSHVDHPSVVAFRTREARIVVSRTAAVYGDGEPVAVAGQHPLFFDLMPRALPVVC